MWIPLWAITYLTGEGDYSHLTDEQKSLADNWRQTNHVYHVAPFDVCDHGIVEEPILAFGDQACATRCAVMYK